MSLVVLPLEQGLKPIVTDNAAFDGESLVVLPLEQGLKHFFAFGRVLDIEVSLVVLPLEQGLKLLPEGIDLRVPALTLS